MNTTASSRDTRALAAGSIVIALIFVGFKGYPAWRDWQQSLRVEATRRIVYAQRVSTTLNGFADQLDSLEARSKRLVDSRDSFIAADSLGAAPVRLQAIVSEAAAAAMVRVEAMQTRMLPPSDSALPRVELELKGIGDIAGVSALLRRVETGSPMLAIRQLRVRPHDVGSPADSPELLAISLLVEAVVLETGRRLP